MRVTKMLFSDFILPFGFSSPFTYPHFRYSALLQQQTVVEIVDVVVKEEITAVIFCSLSYFSPAVAAVATAMVS